MRNRGTDGRRSKRTVSLKNCHVQCRTIRRCAIFTLIPRKHSLVTGPAACCRSLTEAVPQPQRRGNEEEPFHDGQSCPLQRSEQRTNQLAASTRT